MNTKTLSLAIGAVLWAIAPLVLEHHDVDLLVFSAIYAIAGLGVALLLGQCGIVNLAQAAFYGIGAYATAYSATHWQLPAPLGIGLGMGISLAIAVVVGWPILRMSGFFLAMATLAVSLICSVLFFEWDDITGGTLGMGGIPKLNLFGFVLDTPQRFYYFVWPLLGVVMVLARNLVHGRPGFAMRAMRDSAPAAEVLAIDMHRLRVAMFALSAVLGSLAGSIYAHYMSFVSVQSFSIEQSVLFLVIPVVAGAQSVFGIVIGALFIAFLPEWLSRFGDIHQVLFGLALVLVVTLMPGGLSAVVSKLFAKGWKHS